jgi:diguanylate cyclase (GGDEF)-like protein
MRTVLLVSDDSEKTSQWANWLSVTSMAVQETRRLDGIRLRDFDCLVTDRNIVTELRDQDFSLVGIIVIGVPGFGDVQLPLGSPGELRLACRLLAEISTLRRQKKRQTRLAKLNEQLAYVDLLTTLPNRRGWEKFAGNARPSPLAALGFCDLDEFKEVNRTAGYRRGDEVIQVAATCLRQVVPANAFVARWGGDEFLVALPAADPSNANPQRAFTEIREGWIKLLIERGVPLTATIGWSSATDLKEAFTHCEQALRIAKAKQTPVLGAES